MTKKEGMIRLLKEIPDDLLESAYTVDVSQYPNIAMRYNPAILQKYTWEIPRGKFYHGDIMVGDQLVRLLMGVEDA